MIVFFRFFFSHKKFKKAQKERIKTNRLGRSIIELSTFLSIEKLIYLLKKRERTKLFLFYLFKKNTKIKKSIKFN